MSFARTLDRDLDAWFTHPRRKPLVLRGARQTGKTTAVRRLARSASLFLELNLERYDDLALVRTCRSAEDLLARLCQKHDLAEVPKGTLIFLDEVQEYAPALAWLRFFFEDHPEVAVVAAGSLFEVRLRDDVLSFPVGRVQFLRVEPLTFLEYLRATGGRRLADDLEAACRSSGRVEDGAHHLALDRFREFLLVGGLPEAVEVQRTTRNLVEVRRVHDALRQAYREDLLKYGPGGNTYYLEAVLASAPAHYGARFKIRHLAPGEKDKPLARALHMLERAMVLHRVLPTASRAVPLVPRRRAACKLLPLDIGLAASELGVRPEQLAGRDGRAVETLLEGRLAEAFVGVQLLAAHPTLPRTLSFWTREGSAHSNAEVDYLVPMATGVTPVEVKSGAPGSLRSLHQFLAGADVAKGIRLSCSAGGLEQLRVALGAGRELNYELHSVPLYLAELVGS